MKISIAMATYNGASYLQAQLDSLLAQQRLPDELVVADDQSTDATADIVRAFAARAPFTVRLEVNPTRLGVAMNFDRALSLCSGDLVLPSDQDDVWLPEKLAVIEAYVGTHRGPACVMADALLADGALVPTGATKLGQIRAAGLPDSAFVMGCCAAFTGELLAFLLPIPPDQPAHDNWLVQTSELLGLVHRIETPLQYYRRHGNNVSTFHVNRLQRPGALERMREGLAAFARRFTAAGGLRDEQCFFAAAAARMAGQRARLEALVGAERAAEATRRTQARADLLAQRLAIRALPRHRRAGTVWRLLGQGGYRSSGGLPGALKDLLFAGDPRGAA